MTPKPENKTWYCINKHNIIISKAWVTHSTNNFIYIDGQKVAKRTKNHKWFDNYKDLVKYKLTFLEMEYYTKERQLQRLKREIYMLKNPPVGMPDDYYDDV